MKLREILADIETVRVAAPEEWKSPESAMIPGMFSPEICLWR